MIFLALLFLDLDDYSINISQVKFQERNKIKETYSRATFCSPYVKFSTFYNYHNVF